MAAISHGQFQLVEQAARRFSAQAALRTAGIEALGVSCLALLEGIILADMRIALLGAGLGGLGGLQLLRPHAGWLPGYGLAVLGLAAWNLWPGTRPEQSGSLMVLFGLLLLGWATYSCIQFYRLRQVPSQAAAPAVLTWLRAVDNYTRMANPAEATDVIELTMTRIGKPQLWRALLAGDVAIFINQRSRQIVLARRETLQVTRHAIALSRRQPGIEIRLGNQTFDGKISAVALERLGSWLCATDSGGASAWWPPPA